MSNTTSQLLQKVKNSISLRVSDNDIYKSTFRNPISFITATIGGQQEFIPISLLCLTNNKYQTLLELHQVFGNPEANDGLTIRLKDFYAQHGINWPQELDNISIEYYIKPVAQIEADAFFDVASIEKLSKYAGTRYKASDAFLKDLGNTYADKIVDTTNKWAKSLTLPNGYSIEYERYWQVAGRFKSFTWAKIYKEEYKDKKIFFSVGVDVENKQLVFKLDGLRSGTHKLSNFEMRDFDYFTQDKELSITFELNQIATLTLDSLRFLASHFISDLKETYEQAIDFVWNDTVDCSLFTNKLFKLTSSYRSDIEPLKNTIEEVCISDLIIKHEQYTLNYAGQESMASDITTEKVGHINLIRSFETDGKPKNILFKATTGGTSAKFEMSREEIEYLGDNLHTYFYHLIEYNSASNSAKLIIRKGSPTQYAKLKSINYTVEIG